MLPDRVSNPGPLTYESGALPIALQFDSGYLKLLISQNKFSGSRKIILRYQQFEMNIDFEISRVD